VMAEATETRGDAIENLMREDRTFAPPAAFVERANFPDEAVYAQAAADPEGWWAGWAEKLDWITPPTRVLDWSDAPFAKWFADGELNVSANCLDRHVAAGLGDRVAYHWEGEDGDRRAWTYAELLALVERFAGVLTDLGVQRGDRVALFMPMVVELPAAMLACTRIGAAHSCIFGGFSAASLAERIDDADCKVLITADAGWRRGKQVPLKQLADEAMQLTSNIEHCVVHRRMGDALDHPLGWVEGRDRWLDELLEAAPAHVAPVAVNSEDLLYLLYTSGTTARPKGLMHTTGGYLTGVVASMEMVLDAKPDTDVYWCAADVGWVTGHSYIVYGPLALGMTSVLYEGAPDWPGQDRNWEIVERYGVTTLYTAPTAIRAFIKWGDHHPASHDLSSLRLLGSVGEPINPEAWMWYHRVIGGERCPIVDTWWQTETGHHMISPMPGITHTKPGSAARAIPGIAAAVVDEAGVEVPDGHGGYLVIKAPWPGMTRGIWGDPERFRDTYWAKWPGLYFAGDGAKLDDDGFIWLLGRVDDVMNVSGHRISTMEVESALVEHEFVAEAAVVGMLDELTGEAIAAFVTIDDADSGRTEDELRAELIAHVSERIGKFCRPKLLVFTEGLPKTRSGKIMRRLLKDVAEGRDLGDTTTLQDAAVVDQLAAKVAALRA
ncbi:MAG: acetyl-coenzyme synthetase, partial [Thermoleophilia bacterium]|nr:acetyl-coenzyme synthetase [Thermoleophilia bacterium]